MFCELQKLDFSYQEIQTKIFKVGFKLARSLFEIEGEEVKDVLRIFSNRIL